MMSKPKFAKHCFYVTAVILVMAAILFYTSCSKAGEKNENRPDIPPLQSNSSTTGQSRSGLASFLFDNNNDSGVIEIRERMFATQVNDVYTNPDDYLGRTIKLEGIFMTALSHADEDPFCSVIRYAPGGCCGNDGMAGFEVKWTPEQAEPFPTGYSWVEATGVLKEYEEGIYKYLYLDLSELTVLSKRGAEYVRQ